MSHTIPTRISHYIDLILNHFGNDPNALAEELAFATTEGGTNSNLLEQYIKDYENDLEEEDETD